MKWRRPSANDLDAELKHHLAMLEDEHRGRGLSPEDARLAARRDLGGVLRTQEAYREQAGFAWLDTLARDVRLAFRSLSRAHGLSAAIIVTLALGIGANTAIFSVVRTVQWKPLPYKDPDRLVVAFNYEGPTENLQSFERLAIMTANEQQVEAGDIRIQVPAVTTSAPLSELFGVPLFMGRDFLPSEFGRGLPREALTLISHRLFLEQYAGDPSILGRTVKLWMRPHVIIGVLPPNFRLPLPRQQAPTLEPDFIVNSFYKGWSVGRLKAGVSPQAAQDELRALNTSQGRVNVSRLHDFITQGTRRELVFLWSAVACVLLIACLNVTTLLLSRSLTRMPETSVRAALGAGRWDLIRPVLAETSLLAMGGGVFGLGLAYAILGYVRSLRGVTLPRLPDVNLDQQSVVYAAVCCAAAALLAGIGPIAGVLQPRLLPALRSRGETTSSSGKSLRLFHRSLASLQIALALVLLSGAGVLIKHLMDIAPGLADADPRHVMIGSLGSAMIPPEVPNSRAAVRRYMFDRDREILRQIRLVPDVRSAALFTGDLVPSAPVRIQGHTEVSHSFVRTDATAQFFAASGYRLRAGRLFGNGEFNGDDRARPVVVNEEFLRIFAADLTPQSALGRTVVRRDPKGIAQHFGTIAGVVNNLNVRATKVEPGIFRAADEKSWPALLLVRTTGDPLELTGNVGRILREHHVPLVEPHTLEDRFTSAVATRRFERNLLASFAGVALVLAVIGIYGVLSYGVSQRTREIGIRMALGAERFDVLVDVLRDGLLLIGCGAVLGLAASFALARWMSSMIPGLPSSEPAMLAIVCVMLIVVAAAAAFVPARRATAIDPLPAVRHE